MLKAIYVLRDPRNGITRYVGATAQSLPKRLGMHVHYARAGRTWRCAVWIRSLLTAGYRPLIICIQPACEDWQAAEKAAIAKLRADGLDLLNETAGGLGMLSCRPTRETRSKRSKTLKARYARDPDQMATRQQLARNSARTPAAREAARARMKAIWADPVRAAEMRAAMKGKKRSATC